MPTPTDPQMTVLVPGTAMPIADLIAADGSFVDAAGNPIPFVDVSGDFSTTTTDTITSGKTQSVTVADGGLSVGDWVVLTNGALTDVARQVTLVDGDVVTVSTPFGIAASGTSTLTRKKVRPSLSWDLSGKPFGQLAYANKKLTGLVQVDSTTNNVSKGAVEVQIIVAGKVKATKVAKVAASGLVTCHDANLGRSQVVEFGLAGAIPSGTEVRVRAYATFAYTPVCNVRGGTYTIGPRLSPIYTVP
jgi:hypothetical protein